jgi:hypothetical protein
VRLDELLAAPQLVHCRELWVEYWRQGDTDDFAAWVDALVRHPIGSLRTLTLGGYAGRSIDARLGDPSRLLQAMPNLEELCVAGRADSLGDLSSANLIALELETGCFPVEVAERVLGRSTWPRLTELRLSLEGFDLDDRGFQLIAPLLSRSGPSLDLLELTGLDLSRDHVEQLLRAPLTARLKALLIGQCDLTDAEDALLEVADRLRGLILYLGHDSPRLEHKGVRLAEDRGVAWKLFATDRGR